MEANLLEPPRDPPDELPAPLVRLLEDEEALDSLKVHRLQDLRGVGTGNSERAHSVEYESPNVRFTLGEREGTLRPCLRQPLKPIGHERLLRPPRTLLRNERRPALRLHYRRSGVAVGNTNPSAREVMKPERPQELDRQPLRLPEVGECNRARSPAVALPASPWRLPAVVEEEVPLVEPERGQDFLMGAA